MTDATIDRLARLLGAGHIRWHAGRVQVHPDCAELDSAWLHHHRDAVTVALTPFTDDATAIDRLVGVFPNSTLTASSQPSPEEHP